MNTAAKASELHEDAQLVIEVISDKEDVRLDFSADSILSLDTYIDRHRAKLNEGDKTVLREKFGAFLGETIRRHYGGQWVKGNGNHWMIAFGEQNLTSPFDMISDHLDNQTSLTQFFQHIPDHINRRASQN